MMKRLLETIEGTFAMAGIFSLVVISFLAVNQLNPILETPVSASVAGISDVKTNLPIKYTNIFDTSKFLKYGNAFESEKTDKGINYIVLFSSDSSQFNQKVISVYNPNNNYREVYATLVASDYLQNDLKVTLSDSRDSIVVFDSSREENPPMRISFDQFDERIFTLNVESSLNLQNSQIAIQFTNAK